MKYFVFILFLIAWILNLTATTMLAPLYGTDPMLSVMFLFALTTWKYGISKALVILLFYIPYYISINLMYYDHGVIVAYDANKIVGPSFAIITVYVSGTLKHLHAEVVRLKTDLEDSIEERTQELHEITKQLIEIDEETRVTLAQDIHDGLGQYLTGLLLYSDSLCSGVLDENRDIRTLADDIARNSQTSLNLARRVSRTLFPIKIAETGMKIAIQELVDCFSQLHNIHFETHITTDCLELDYKKNLYLYRIIYGAILHEIYYGHPQDVSLVLKRTHDCTSLLIRIDGSKPLEETEKDSMELKLIHYRAHEIGANLSIDQSAPCSARIECNVSHR